MIKKFHYATIDSTQDQAKKLIKEGDNNYLTPDSLLLITADEQTKGRGRFGRIWYSPKDSGLYISLVQKIKKDFITDELTQQTTLQIISALQSFFSKNNQNNSLEKIYLKPINDIYYNEKKLAGILCEIINHDSEQFLITGIGINLEKIILAESTYKESDGKNAEAISLAEILAEEGQELSLDKAALAEHIATQFLKKHLEKI